MKILAILAGLLMAATPALAAVTVTAPASLVTSPMTALSSSGQIALFEFTINQDAGETLASVTMQVNSSAAVASDFASVSLYKDNGNGSYDSADLQAGTNATVNVGSPTAINATANNTLTGGKFFVTIATSATFGAGDSFTASMPVNAIATSANSPATSAVTTAAISFDSVAPTLSSAVAQNTGTTSAKEVGDSVLLTFSEATNKPVINASNIASVLVLNNSHSWLDGAGAIGSANWSSDGTKLTVTLSAGTSVPTVEVGDSVTVAGSVIKDLAGNNATGSSVISGSFNTNVTPPANDDDDEEIGTCSGSSIINGRLYKVVSSPTVYLAAACRLKPFRGAAVFHARGYKFQNIIVLSSLSGLNVSELPALPAGGTLVKGSDKTVWFVTGNGKRKGFVSAEAFTRLGFKFNQVKTISNDDLNMIPSDTPIQADESHPEGTLVKCGVSATIFEVKGTAKFPFANADAFKNRGHSFEHVVSVDCGRFAYVTGTTIAQ